MLTGSFHHVIANAAAAKFRQAMRLWLPPHATPVFSAAETGEQALITRIALKASGYNVPDADGFDLAARIPIAKSKTRFLRIDESL